MLKKKKPLSEQQLYELKIADAWRVFWKESFSYWMICAYLFVEYVRPQSIWTWLDFLPWAQLFIVLACVGWFFNSKEKRIKSPFSKWLVLFLGSVTLSSVFAYWPEYSYERYSFFALWVVIYFLIINIVNTEKRLLIFLLIFIFASYKISLSLTLIWGARGFSFTDWGLQGPPGFFQNSGELAIQMAVYWPIALAIAMAVKPYTSTLKFLILCSMPATAAMVILGASSRGGQLALLVQVAVYFHKQIFKPKAIIAIALIMSLGFMLLPDSQKDRFSNIGEDRSSRQRMLYWEHGYEMLQDHPAIGVGYFNFVPYYERFYTDDMLYPNAQLAHNILIQVGADLGYIGLGLYLALIILMFWETHKLSKLAPKTGSDLLTRLPKHLNISFIGFVIAGQFVSVVYYPFMWIHLSFVVCVGYIIRSKLASMEVK